jgi:hypothetical protein
MTQKFLIEGRKTREELNNTYFKECLCKSHNNIVNQGVESNSGHVHIPIRTITVAFIKMWIQTWDI